MFRKTYVDVDLSSLKSNLEYFKSKFSKNVFCCPMLKANAYGHGDYEVARICQEVGVSAIGVVCLEEALKIAKTGFSLPILLFTSLNEDMFPEILDPQMIAVVGDFRSLNLLIQSGKDKEIHLEINTGMNRLGFRLEELSDLKILLEDHPFIKVSGICTHLLAGEEIDEDSYSKKQLDQFENAIASLSFKNIVQHVYKSSSGLLKEEINDNYGIRPGISLYGVYPDSLEQRLDILSPVMSWITSVVDTQKIKKGETVSYGAKWKAERDSTIAVLGVGYADGYPRSASNNAHVIIAGEFYKQIGTVCMDYIMVDITDYNNEEDIYNQDVVLIGGSGDKFIGFEELALWSNKIPYEIMVSISPRVYRLYSER